MVNPDIAYCRGSKRNRLVNSIAVLFGSRAGLHYYRCCMEKPFRTLRGFLAGKEREQGTYFAYSATLRIYGNLLRMEEISAALGLQPTDSHRKGERRDRRAAPYPHEMWSYSPDVDKSEPLPKHIDALCQEADPAGKGREVMSHRVLHWHCFATDLLTRGGNFVAGS
jgi:hypothetical protein